MPPITWKLHLRSTPETVFRFLTTAEGREKFWAEMAPENDGSVHFRFINGQSYRSRILASEPFKLYVIEYFNSKAAFTLIDDGKGGTDLTLVNSEVPREDYMQNYAGWVSVLMALKAAADFDIDLRSHDAGRTWDDHYVDN